MYSLRGTNIDDTGMKALAKSLKNCVNMTELV